jgi:bacillopeptidase F (M6 metalloprotease family)
MRNSINILTILLLSIVLFSCKKDDTKTSMNNQPQVFTTPDEAAKKGKSDMLEILRNKSVNLSVDAGMLESSQPGKLIKHIEMDFDKLIKTDSVKKLSDLSKAELNTIAPLVSGDRVAGIVELSNTPKGWQVAGLSDKQTMDDLNLIISSSGQKASDMNITIYEVPNLQVMIYGVTRNDTDSYYLNYGENNLRQGISISAFYPKLKEDAVMFNQKYREMIKKQKLLK